MPSHSRSRDHYRDRERERERERESPSRRRYRDETVDIEEDDDADRHRKHRSSRQRRGQSRGYESQGYHEVDVHDEQGYGGADDTPTRKSRPQRSHDESRSSPRRTRPREEHRRDRTSKAKESPATSPKKRTDREGHRRGDGRHHDGSPSRGTAMRERRHRRRADDDIDTDRERERELRRQRRRERERERVAEKHTSTESTNSASQLLKADALAKLNDHYEREKRRDRDRDHERTRASAEEDIQIEKRRHRRQEAVNEKQQTYNEDEMDTPRQHSQKRRLVSGAIMEEGRSGKLRFWRRGGGGSGSGPGDNDSDGNGSDHGMPFWKKRKRLWIVIGLVLLALAIAIPVGIVVSKNHSSNNSSSSASASGSTGSTGSSSSSNLTASLANIDPNSIPMAAKGSYLDPFTWLDTRDFNLTYTNETVGGLPIMGLNSTWDDSAQPNKNVPALNKKFPYGSQPIRGVNLGGWLSIEPFITPSFFAKYPLTDGVVDEWTLSQKLGPSAASTIEQHYTTFIQEDDFSEIAAAGLDHVRIQYSYWAVTTYSGDPYVEKISWRYLLRAIEYCRKYGLRVNLDLHGIPGSQNGWNHSGRQGVVGWLNGTDGSLNAQRSLDLHNQLSQFFAQPRYKNVITIYGLCNEPKMLSIPVEAVVNWTTTATELVQKNGISAQIVFGDGFLNLDKWQFILKSGPPNMLLDTHQYTIFNMGELPLTHAAKINLTCNQWNTMLVKVNSTTNGWGPTICGEFSQADTDCTEYLNNVGAGTRWTGSYDPSNTTPSCPTATGTGSVTKGSTACSCTIPNSPVSSYTNDYKKFLQTYAESQISAYEQAMGWFYWTWQTESAPQWSYKQARAGGFMPQLAYEPAFKCGDAIPDFGSLPEYY